MKALPCIAFPVFRSPVSAVATGTEASLDARLLSVFRLSNPCGWLLCCLIFWTFPGWWVKGLTAVVPMVPLAFCVLPSFAFRGVCLL
ncbi:hypothetical protein D805_0449 [Bifidobacterium thermophilum RBL67]|uniref:Uncharacterized protein n=1 Tax=Bifidobacterium thermophilum RBL67 TaxID=1254439 RepID=M4RB72_9BIFI|nr:hypothetical protein D805_0449 [Bifidobacterium thermophilum RBL67]